MNESPPQYEIDTATANDQAVDVLNRLLQAEYHSLVPRLAEVRPFVDWDDAELRALVERLTADAETHIRDIAEAIIQLRGAPVTPRRCIMSTGMHYIQLEIIIPDVIADIRKMIDTYKAVGQTGNADADTLIANILADHKQHLADLEKRA